MTAGLVETPETSWRRERRLCQGSELELRRAIEGDQRLASGEVRNPKRKIVGLATASIGR
jgi:hypothetical protein